jgi:glycosyltransferase involved in cell wall biosynthesis
MKVAYLTNVVPAYRTDFFRRLLSDSRFDVTVFCHADIHGHTVELIPSELHHRLVRCEAKQLLGGAAIFEKLPFKSILSDYDVIISDGNPRHTGFAIVSTIAALMGKRVIIWSTLHSRRNRPLTQWLRLAWWRLFQEFFSYTDPDAENLRAKFPGKLARSTNNGLDQETMDRAKRRYSSPDLAKFRSGLGLDGKRIGLSIGRALPGRFDLMAAVLIALKKRDSDFFWILLGSGEGLSQLKAEFEASGVEDCALLAGAVHDEEELAKWFRIADLFVYPDAIGLSLYHAFGYGLPVVTHADREVHGPEMGVFKEGVTGLTFEPGDADDMADQICKLLADCEKRRQMGEHALQIVRERYNAEIMYQRFTEALLDPNAQF